MAYLELLLKMPAPALLCLLELVGGEDALLGQLPSIDFKRRRMVGDGLVHQRLCEAGLVALVVAVAAIAEHVDDDRLVEALAELGRDLGGVDNSFRIIAIRVEDRRLDDLRDV